MGLNHIVGDLNEVPDYDDLLNLRSFLLKNVFDVEKIFTAEGLYRLQRWVDRVVHFEEKVSGDEKNYRRENETTKNHSCNLKETWQETEKWNNDWNNSWEEKSSANNTTPYYDTDNNEPPQWQWDDRSWEGGWEQEAKESPWEEEEKKGFSQGAPSWEEEEEEEVKKGKEDWESSCSEDEEQIADKKKLYKSAGIINIGVWLNKPDTAAAIPRLIFLLLFLTNRLNLLLYLAFGVFGIDRNQCGYGAYLFFGVGDEISQLRQKINRR